MREYAAARDAAWEGRPRQVPATDRKPLHTLEGTGIELTEALYAGIVKVLFEDAGGRRRFQPGRLQPCAHRRLPRCWSRPERARATRTQPALTSAAFRKWRFPSFREGSVL